MPYDTNIVSVMNVAKKFWIDDVFPKLKAIYIEAYFFLKPFCKYYLFGNFVEIDGHIGVKYESIRLFLRNISGFVMII